MQLMHLVATPDESRHQDLDQILQRISLVSMLSLPVHISALPCLLHSANATSCFVAVTHSDLMLRHALQMPSMPVNFCRCQVLAATFLLVPVLLQQPAG